MPKLPVGMFKRGPSYYYRSRAGGRDQKRSLGRDFFEACRKLREIQAGVLKPFARVTVKAAAAQWLENEIKVNRNPKNLKVAAVRVQRYLEPALGYRRVDQVTVDDLRRYRLWLQQQGKSPQTVVHILADARAFFRWCEELGFVARAPIPRKLLPKLEEREPRGLTDEEVEALLQIREPWRFVIRFSLATGMRWGEISRADARHRTKDGWLVVERTKSHKMRRIPLAETDPALEREVARRVGKLIPFSESSSGTFNRTVRRLSGVQGFTHHRLRHTFAYRWHARGGNIVALKEVLGHSDIKMTLRYASATAEFVRMEARRQAAGAELMGTVAGTVSRESSE